MSIRERLRGASISSVLLHGMPTLVGGTRVIDSPGLPDGVEPPSTAVRVRPAAYPETPEYVDARTEAAATCRNLGLDITNVHWDTASIADYVRLAYAQGFRACVAKVESPDTADAIAVAIETPEIVISAPGGAFRTTLVHQVASVQRAAIYGVPKELKAEAGR
ncbi:hypothetical protein [Kribbella sp. NPDC051718]|uniref:hypothetical protein n=1 Tax=Kribbella sp. NPDC051718 TaxID=3155168 RepID=UPI00342656A0